eukprot:6387717-Pyramimonas_sp.AAC.1
MGDSLRLGVDMPAVRGRFIDRTKGGGAPGRAKGKGFREGNDASRTRTGGPWRSVSSRQLWVYS